jgi:hypothetical protein
MSIALAQDVVLELMRTEEYARDPIVHGYVTAWRAGHARADQVLLELIRALSRQNRKLIDTAVRVEQWRPSLPLDLLAKAAPESVP